MPVAQASSTPSWTRTQRRLLVILEIGLILLLSALALWKGIIPAWQYLNTDFPNYYVAARLIRSHYCLDRLYDWIWFQRVGVKFGISHQLIGFLGLTPFSALPILPLSWLPVLEAKRAWIICNIVLLAAALYLLARQSALSYRTAWLIALCAVIPLRTSFLFGQMHILVLLLLAAAYASHMRGRQIASGCCIALAAALKIYPIFFCAYFLIKRRWKALGAALAAMGLCFLLSLILTGPEATKAYLFQQLPRSLQGESGNPFLPTLTSSSALFHRLFLSELELNPHPLILSPALYALLYPLWQAILAGIVLSRIRGDFRADERETLEWSMFLCLLMFLSSAPASYQFVALIAAAVPTMSILIKQRRWRATLIYLALFIASCNARTITVNGSVSLLTPLLYVKLWCGVALIVFYCVLLKPVIADRHTSTGKVFVWSASWAFPVAACLWILGAASAWHHVSRTRAADPIVADASDAAYMKISPVATDTGVSYVAMLAQRYRVLSTGEPSFSLDHGHNSAIDELSFTTAPSEKDLWIEEASTYGSRVVHIIENLRIAGAEIDDAETPVLSSDQSVLAFVREDHGNGRLWTIDLHNSAEPGSFAAQAKVTPSSFDVRSVAAGVGNAFLVCAIYQGKESVFTVGYGLPPRLLAQGDGALDSAALSRDGKMLAVRELIRERWQLTSLNLSSRTWKQLTHGDCNAYTPSWKDDHTLIYATDCMRGMGLATLASLTVDR